jgi:hypothetical protein
LPLLFLLAGLLLGLLWGGLKAYRLLQLARSFQARFDEVVESGVRDDPMQLDTEWAGELVRGTRADFVELKGEVEFWLWLAPAFRWLPTIGPDLVLAPQFLEMGDAGTEMAVLLADGLLPTLDLVQSGSMSTGALVGELSNARPQLAAAEGEMARIAAARAAIPPGEYSSITGSLLDKLDQYLPLAQTGLRGVQVLPGIMGADGPRTYLLIAQNEDEIRPTGGFFSSVGLLTVDQGEIIALSFEDSYAVDDWINHPYPDLPLPFQEIMGDGIWLFRDANWSPDWPTSARQAIVLYQIGRDVPIDGVIAADQRAVQLLVGPLAPLVVGKGFELVTSGNVQEFMRQSWLDPAEGEEGEWWRYRKAFIGNLAAAMQDKLLADLGSVDLPALAAAIQTALDEKHILLYFQDPESTLILHQAGWDGALRSYPGDSLMVVDANMGFNKVASIIRRQIEYQVVLTENENPRAQVTLTYSHLGNPRDEPCHHEPFYKSVSGYAELVDRCYWAYVRVYPPAGAVPLDGSQHPLSGDFLTSQRDWPGEMVVALESNDQLSLANFLLLPWGASEIVQFRYQLPPTVLDQSGSVTRYRLLLQKQPGTIGDSVRVVVQLPAGAELLTTTPAASRSGDELLFELTLVTDQEILLEWSN